MEIKGMPGFNLRVFLSISISTASFYDAVQVPAFLVGLFAKCGVCMAGSGS